MNDTELRLAYKQLLAERDGSPDQGSVRAGCPSPEALLAVVERSGAFQLRERTLAHVSTCLECQRDLNLLRAVRATRSRLNARIVPLMAAASVLLVIGALVTQRTRDTREVMRATQGLVLVAPKGSARAENPLNFMWNAMAGAESYRLRIVNDEGATIVDRTVRDTTLVVSDLMNVPAGREFVWTVTARLTDGRELRSEPVTFRIDNLR